MTGQGAAKPIHRVLPLFGFMRVSWFVHHRDLL
jgi:hypothetical protein